MIGQILCYGGNTIPTRWLLCNGSAINRVTYAKLYSVIGTTYGSGNGSTTFNLPNLSGRVPIGAGTSGATGATNHTLGQASGEETHLLTLTEIPSHNHGGKTGGMSANAKHSHKDGTNSAGIFGVVAGNTTCQVTANADSGRATTEADLSHTHTITANGGGGSHNNMQPYLTINYIIYAGI